MLWGFMCALMVHKSFTSNNNWTVRSIHFGGKGSESGYVVFNGWYDDVKFGPMKVESLVWFGNTDE